MAWELADVPWTTARERLFPVLRRASEPVGHRHAVAERAPLRTPIAPFLGELLSIDLDRELRFASMRMIAAWGRTQEEVRAVAAANLAAAVPPPSPGYPAGWRVESPGAAALWRLPGWLVPFHAHVDGPLTIALPTPDAVWMIGADDPAFARWTAAVAAAAEQADRPLSPAVYRVEGRRVEGRRVEGRRVEGRALTPWLGSAAAWFGQQTLAGQEYAAQAEDLVHLGVTETLVPLRIARRGASMWTEARWEGVGAAWLPEVERVSLPDGDHPWASLADRLVPLDVDPPRWRIDGHCGSGRSTRPLG